jgi:hypothetical protein
MKENSCPCLFAIFHNLIAALAPTERIFIFPSHAGDAYVSSPCVSKHKPSVGRKENKDSVPVPQLYRSVYFLPPPNYFIIGWQMA